MPPIATDVIVALSVCPSVTLVHPAKAVGHNEMPFGRDTYVVSSNIVLDRGRGHSPPREEEIWGSEAPVKICIGSCG